MLDLDPDRRLALSYVPAAARSAVEALWRLDVALAAVLAIGREPLISRIRLAWWRESLEKLDRERAPAEPVLEALSRHVIPAGVSGAELAAMEEGWAILLSTDPLTREDLEIYAAARGGLLFRYSARLLGLPGAAVEAGGEAWALVDLARHSADGNDAKAALQRACNSDIPRTWPTRSRPLGMLAMLARRDAERGLDQWEPQGAPARMLKMLRHRLTGR